MSKINYPKSAISQRLLRPEEAVPLQLINQEITDLILLQHPTLKPNDGFISRQELQIFRYQHLKQLMERELGELSPEEKAVLETFRLGRIFIPNQEESLDQSPTWGERIADLVAAVCGSWPFILGFVGLIALWISFNLAQLTGTLRFDPFPFILLNLLLSCVAGLQGPVILMAQNRMSKLDRIRAIKDYEVNLKSEVELFQLHEKIDQLAYHQLQRTAELERINNQELIELRKLLQLSLGQVPAKP